MPLARAGLSFDTGASPEEARDLLASASQPVAPADSWLRLRNMDNSFVRDSAGAEIPLWPAAKPEHSLVERRAALARLQAQGFHLVALLRWNPESWPHGIRSEHPLRRLPIDLRDAFDRCRALAASYGDLIDYWEIDNEPDIGFVEENPETYAAFLKACYLGIAAGRPMADAGGQTPEARGPEDQKARRPENQNAGVSGERANLPVEISDSSSRASGPPILGPSGIPSSALRPPASGISPPSSVLRPPASRTRSRVLMAPLALPPGPYFTAFIANGGLRYTDGFNYHYYGYASDFTGVYEQFREAVTEAIVSDDGGRRPDAENPEDQKSGQSPARPSAPPTSGFGPPSSVLRPPPPALPSDVAILTTRFYPNTRGWVSVPIFDFDFPAAAAAAHRTQLEARPLADAEPRLTPQGRWLVSSGVTVEETPGSWRIRVDRLPAEPMRPAVAELPLPDGWESDPNTLLTFAYRIVPEGELKAGISEGQMTGRPEGPMVRRPDDQRASVQTSAPPTIQPSAPSTFGSSDHPASAPAFRPSDPPPLAPSALPSSVLRPPASGIRPPASGIRPPPSVLLPLAHRELPVFLTEYGYGLLSKEARDTPEGRARQASWFKQVQSQIHALGIARAMAFLLKPYLDNDRQEFGLLMQAKDGDRTPEAGSREDRTSGKPEDQRTRSPDDQKSSVPASDPTIRPPGLPAAAFPSSDLRPPSSVLRPPSSRLPSLKPSPALSALIADSTTPIPAQAWSTSEPSPQTSIVIDFVAGTGLTQSKNYTGYLAGGDFGLPGQPASARLVVYNFGSAAITGDLQLAGASWTLADASRMATLTLAPGERRELPVLITPAPIFAPQPATVTFRPSAFPALRSSDSPPSGVRPPTSGVNPSASIQPEARPIAMAIPGQLIFDVYIRMANGNLFSVGSPFSATDAAQHQAQRLGNLSMAFFGRAELPWRFETSEPAALVFFVRPDPKPLPVTLEISRADTRAFLLP
jgi:hypothetical protein